MTNDDFAVEVFSAETPTELSSVEALLSQHGIPSKAKEFNRKIYIDWRYRIQLVHGLFVAEKDSEQAHKVIDQFLRTAPSMPKKDYTFIFVFALFCGPILFLILFNGISNTWSTIQIWMTHLIRLF
jgi:hypothetical protein